MKGKEIPPQVWTEIKNQYIGGQATLAELALKHRVGKSTLMNKAATENWSALRKTGITVKENVLQDPQIKFGEIPDSSVIVDEAILILRESLPEARSRSKEAIALALCKLIELRVKMNPPTVLDLVERAIDLGFGPDEFLSELKRRWNESN